MLKAYSIPNGNEHIPKHNPSLDTDTHFETVVSRFRAVSDAPNDYAPPTPEAVAAAEQALGVRLPSTYVEFLRRTADVRVEAWDILRIYETSPPPGEPDDIVHANRFEHSSTFPSRLIAFWSNGAGDFDCFDRTGSEGSATFPVFSWCHDDDPEEAVYQSHSDFVAWLAEQVNDIENRNRR